MDEEIYEKGWRTMTKEKAQYGDVIFADHGLYKHYGIYSGEDRVIHYAPLDASKLIDDDAIIHEGDMKEFLHGAETYGICEFSDDLDIGELIWSLCNPSHVSLGDVMQALENRRVYSPEDTVQRARERIGEKQYDLVENNCEHFVVWCKTGISDSRQVDFVLGWVPVIRLISDWLK